MNAGLWMLTDTSPMPTSRRNDASRMPGISSSSESTAYRFIVARGSRCSSRESDTPARRVSNASRACAVAVASCPSWPRLRSWPAMWAV